MKEKKNGQTFNYTSASVTNIFRVKDGKSDGRHLPDRRASASTFCTTLLPYLYVMTADNKGQLVLIS
jgi:hypothetical protein